MYSEEWLLQFLEVTFKTQASACTNKLSPYANLLHTNPSHIIISQSQLITKHATEDIPGSQSTVPCIFNLGPKPRWVVNIISQPVYPLGKARMWSAQKLNGSYSQSCCGSTQKYLYLCQELNCYPEKSIVTILIWLSKPLFHLWWFNF
jgi:hypothetical protein